MLTLPQRPEEIREISILETELYFGVRETSLLLLCLTLIELDLSENLSLCYRDKN